MIIEHFKDYDTMSAACADIILSEAVNFIDQKKFCNLGLPTGNTPKGMYLNLANKDIDWSSIRTFNLDEYMIEDQDENSFHTYMKQHLHSKVNIPSENIFFPRLEEDYDKIIDQLNGLDLTILGIGLNGHIAFNEPGSAIQSKTRKVTLTEFTRAVNSGPFGVKDKVPREAITMGLNTILSSKKIIVMAQGILKLSILKKSFWERPTELLPASCLQLHNDVRIFYCD